MLFRPEYFIINNTTDTYSSLNKSINVITDLVQNADEFYPIPENYKLNQTNRFELVKHLSENNFYYINIPTSREEEFFPYAYQMNFDQHLNTYDQADILMHCNINDTNNILIIGKQSILVAINL
jgi:hypothetical protein